MSQDIVKIWMVKFAEPPVIRQIRQGFCLPKIHAIQYHIMQIIGGGKVSSRLHDLVIRRKNFRDCTAIQNTL